LVVGCLEHRLQAVRAHVAAIESRDVAQEPGGYAGRFGLYCAPITHCGGVVAEIGQTQRLEHFSAVSTRGSSHSPPGGRRQDHPIKPSLEASALPVWLALDDEREKPPIRLPHNVGGNHLARRPRVPSCIHRAKATSSRLLRKEFAEKVKRGLPQARILVRSYCIISCGGAPLSILKQYIEQQDNPD